MHVDMKDSKSFTSYIANKGDQMSLDVKDLGEWKQQINPKKSSDMVKMILILSRVVGCFIKLESVLKERGAIGGQ